MTTQTEQDLRKEIERLELNAKKEAGKCSCNEFEYHLQDSNIFNCSYKELQAKLSGYLLAKKETEREQMKKGNFNTSMNRKVCYDEGYEKAIEETAQKVKKLKEEIKNKAWSAYETIRADELDKIIDKYFEVKIE
jgi:hypothetical protein